MIQEPIQFSIHEDNISPDKLPQDEYTSPPKDIILLPKRKSTTKSLFKKNKLLTTQKKISQFLSPLFKKKTIKKKSIERANYSKIKELFLENLNKNSEIMETKIVNRTPLESFLEKTSPMVLKIYMFLLKSFFCAFFVPIIGGVGGLIPTTRNKSILKIISEISSKVIINLWEDNKDIVSFMSSKIYSKMLEPILFQIPAFEEFLKIMNVGKQISKEIDDFIFDYLGRRIFNKDTIYALKLHYDTLKDFFERKSQGEHPYANIKKDLKSLASVSAAFVGIFEIILCGVKDKSYCGKLRIAEKVSYLCPLVSDLVVDMCEIMSKDMRHQREKGSLHERIFMAFCQYCRQQFKFDSDIFQTSIEKKVEDEQTEKTKQQNKTQLETFNSFLKELESSTDLDAEQQKTALVSEIKNLDKDFQNVYKQRCQQKIIIGKLLLKQQELEQAGMTPEIKKELTEKINQEKMKDNQMSQLLSVETVVQLDLFSKDFQDLKVKMRVLQNNDKMNQDSRLQEMKKIMTESQTVEDNYKQLVSKAQELKLVTNTNQSEFESKIQLFEKNTQKYSQQKQDDYLKKDYLVKRKKEDIDTLEQRLKEREEQNTKILEAALKELELTQEVVGLGQQDKTKATDFLLTVQKKVENAKSKRNNDPDIRRFQEMIAKEKLNLDSRQNELDLSKESLTESESQKSQDEIKRLEQEEQQKVELQNNQTTTPIPKISAKLNEFISMKEQYQKMNENEMAEKYNVLIQKQRLLEISGDSVGIDSELKEIRKKEIERQIQGKAIPIPGMAKDIGFSLETNEDLVKAESLLNDFKIANQEIKKKRDSNKAPGMLESILNWRQKESPTQKQDQYSQASQKYQISEQVYQQKEMDIHEKETKKQEIEQSNLTIKEELETKNKLEQMESKLISSGQWEKPEDILLVIKDNHQFTPVEKEELETVFGRKDDQELRKDLKVFLNKSTKSTVELQEQITSQEQELEILNKDLTTLEKERTSAQTLLDKYKSEKETRKQLLIQEQQTNISEKDRLSIQEIDEFNQQRLTQLQSKKEQVIEELKLKKAQATPEEQRKYEQVIKELQLTASDSEELDQEKILREAHQKYNSEIQERQQQNNSEIENINKFEDQVLIDDKKIDLQSQESELIKKRNQAKTKFEKDVAIEELKYIQDQQTALKIKEQELQSQQKSEIDGVKQRYQQQESDIYQSYQHYDLKMLEKEKEQLDPLDNTNNTKIQVLRKMIRDKQPGLLESLLPVPTDISWEGNSSISDKKELQQKMSVGNAHINRYNRDIERHLRNNEYEQALGLIDKKKEVLSNIKEELQKKGENTLSEKYQQIFRDSESQRESSTTQKYQYDLRLKSKESDQLEGKLKKIETQEQTQRDSKEVLIEQLEKRKKLSTGQDTKDLEKVINELQKNDDLSKIVVKEENEKIFEPYVDINSNFDKKYQGKKAIDLARDKMKEMIDENNKIMKKDKKEYDQRILPALPFLKPNFKTPDIYNKNHWGYSFDEKKPSDQQVKDFWDKKGEGYFTRGFYNIDPQLRSIYPKSYKEFEELTKPQLKLSDKKIKQLVDKNKMEEKKIDVQTSLQTLEQQKKELTQKISEQSKTRGGGKQRKKDKYYRKKKKTAKIIRSSKKVILKRTTNHGEKRTTFKRKRV